MTVAIRPEDLALLPTHHAGALSAVVEQVSDLGHYRRALLDTGKLGSLKIYLPKTFSAGEGASVFIYIRRCLVYQNSSTPHEITQPLPQEALTVQDD